MSTGRRTRPGQAEARARKATLSTAPFLLKGGQTGCLLVHGLTSSPYEMRFLGERLHAAGHTVSAVRLAGHGTRPEDLEGCGWRDWYCSAEEGLATLLTRCTTVVVVGLSLGSLLALRLAYGHRQEVSGLVLLSPALVLRNPWPERLFLLATVVWPWLPKGYGYWNKGDSDIEDPLARRRHPAYRTMPLRSIVELVRLQAEVKGILREVTQPALAIQARQDHAIRLENLAILQQELPNLWGTVILPAGYHVVTVDVEKERVAAEVVRFVGQIVDNRRTGRRRPLGKR